MSDLTDLTLSEARNALTKGDFTATELTNAYLQAIDAGNERLNAYISITAETSARNGRGVGRENRQGRGAGRWKAFRSASRICTPRRVSTPRPVRTFSMASNRPTNPPSRRTCGTMGR